MAFEFKLPDIGEGVVEGEIVKWLVKPGDAIEVDQPMVEVMTDKATVVIPSPKKGVVAETRGGEGDIVEVHSVIVVIDEAGGGAAPAPESAPAKQEGPSDEDPPSDGQTLKNVGERVASGGRPEGETPAAPTKAQPQERPSHGGQVLAAPATRRLARELGVDLASVSGSGPAGRVTSDDVRSASSSAPAPAAEARAPQQRQQKAPAPQPAAAPGAEDERIPVRGLRRRIWDNMALSAFTAAHFTFVEECDATELVAIRKRFNERLKDGEAKLSYLPFIVKATLASLKQFPQFNGHVDDDNMEFIRRANYHIGIAVSSERGLIVPVVRHADRLSLLELSAEIARLANAVRTNSLRQEDLGGSTFTITSLGKDGGIFATPIINYPEVAIMGVHKMVKRPMVRGEDEIVIRDMMNLSLSFDHRLIDGHVGAAFAYSVIRLLESPDRLMMEMA